MEQLKAEWLKAQLTSNTSRFHERFQGMLLEAGVSNDLSTELAAWVQQNDSPAASVGLAEGWEVVDKLCVWASSGGPRLEAAMHVAKGCLQRVRAREIALMSMEKLYDQRDVGILQLCLYLLQLAMVRELQPLSNPNPNPNLDGDVLPWLTLVKDTITKFLYTHKRDAVVCKQGILLVYTFVCGIATQSLEWLNDWWLGLGSSLRLPSTTIAPTELNIYLGSLVLSGLSEIGLGLGLDVSSLIDISSKGLSVIEMLGFSVQDLLHHPLRAREASWRLRAQQMRHDKDDIFKGAGERLQSTLSTDEIRHLMQCLNFAHTYTHTYRDTLVRTRLYTHEVIPWQEVSIQKPSNEDEDDDTASAANVRGMSRRYITHRLSLCVTPPLPWPLEGVALLVATAAHLCRYNDVPTHTYTHTNGCLMLASYDMLWCTCLPLCVLLLKAAEPATQQLGLGLLARSIPQHKPQWLIFVDITSPDPNPNPNPNPDPSSDNILPACAFFQEVVDIESADDRSVLSITSAIIAANSADTLGLTQLVINVMTQHPASEVRSKAYACLKLIVKCCEISSRCRLLVKLLDGCPYPAAIGLLLDMISAEIQLSWQSVSRSSKPNPNPNPFASRAVVGIAEKHLTPLACATSHEIAERLDEFMASCMLLRRILLTDTSNITEIRDASTRDKLLHLLRSSLQHLTAKTQRAERRFRRSAPDNQSEAKGCAKPNVEVIEEVETNSHATPSSASQPSTSAGETYPSLGGVLLCKVYMLIDGLQSVLSLLASPNPS